MRGGERRRRAVEGGPLPADVDTFKLVLRPTYVTSWGVSEPPEKIFVLDSEGEAYAEFDVWNSDRSKRYPTFTLEGLLALAGTTLDDRNEVYVSENFTGELPLYRLTGVRLSLSFSFSNFRPMSHADPFNFQPQAKMTVKVSSEGSFVGSQETTYYTGPVGSFDQSGSVVGIRGVKMEYESQGLMGTPDGYTAMMALMSCFVMVGVATAIVDVIGAFIYDSFKDDKIEDDGRATAPGAHDPQHRDHGRALQARRPAGDAQRQRQGFLADAPEGHPQAVHAGAPHVPGPLPGGTEPTHRGHHVPRRLGGGRREVPLRARGAGQERGVPHGRAADHRARTRRNHDQAHLAQTAQRHRQHAHGGRARAGLHTKNCSGVALGGGPWQALGTEDEVELMNGDMVALIMDEGADEEETSVEGVFMYKVTQVENVKPKGSGFWPFW